MYFNLFDFTSKQKNLKNYKVVKNFSTNPNKNIDYKVYDNLYIHIWKKTRDILPVVRYVIGDKNNIIVHLFRGL